MERTLGSNTFDIARSNRRSSSLLGTMKLWQRRIQSRRQLARLDSPPARRRRHQRSPALRRAEQAVLALSDTVTPRFGPA